MSGGLIQLVNKGAQDQLVCGNPSFTHFRSVYKRHTDFAMEQFELVFKTTNLRLPASGSLTLRATVDQLAQLVNDCYVVMTLPNIYSSVYPITPGTHPNVNKNSQAIGYEFQWIRNIGYNMIDHASILINGQEVVRHTGEWMKLYADMNFDANKKAMVNQMVGNLPEIYDPANAYDRINQYPHAVSSLSNPAEPSVYGRVLNVPLHFWFCENVGAALPLGALQNSIVEIVVELRNMYELFTIRDIREKINGQVNPNFGQRIAPDPSSALMTMNNFLSPPKYSLYPSPSNPDLMYWNLNPFIEANYIFLNDAELAHINRTEHSFLIKQIDTVSANGQYGSSNDLSLLMKNLCTQVVWVCQRSDRILANDMDNYTNWVDPYKPPIDTTGLAGMCTSYTTGNNLSTAVSQRDILLESSIILDGKERFTYKQTYFFAQLENYRHQKGQTSSDIPGIYSYSFSLEPYNTQPSGHINGSMFNKTLLRNTFVQPPLVTSSNNPTNNTPPAPVCVLKSTLNLPNPTVVNPGATGPNGQLLYSPQDVISIIPSTQVANAVKTLQYNYTVTAYVESYNYLRVMGGIANVVFSS